MRVYRLRKNASEDNLLWSLSLQGGLIKCSPFWWCGGTGRKQKAGAAKTLPKVQAEAPQNSGVSKMLAQRWLPKAHCLRTSTPPALVTGLEAGALSSRQEQSRGRQCSENQRGLWRQTEPGSIPHSASCLLDKHLNLCEL